MSDQPLICVDRRPGFARSGYCEGPIVVMRAIEEEQPKPRCELHWCQTSGQVGFDSKLRTVRQQAMVRQILAQEQT